MTAPFDREYIELLSDDADSDYSSAFHACLDEITRLTAALSEHKACAMARIERLEKALEKIAAFQPKEKHDTDEDVDWMLAEEWNRAGSYAADVARKALAEGES